MRAIHLRTLGTLQRDPSGLAKACLYSDCSTSLARRCVNAVPYAVHALGISQYGIAGYSRTNAGMHDFPFNTHGMQQGQKGSW